MSTRTAGPWHRASACDRLAAASQRSCGDLFIVSTEDILSNGNVSVYPNPATNNLNISAFVKSNANVSIQLIDLTGRIILDKKIIATNNLLNTFLELNDISNGCYLLKLNDGKNQFTKTIIRN